MRAVTADVAMASKAAAALALREVTFREISGAIVADGDAAKQLAFEVAAFTVYWDRDGASVRVLMPCDIEVTAGEPKSSASMRVVLRSVYDVRAGAAAPTPSEIDRYAGISAVMHGGHACAQRCNPCR